MHNASMEKKAGPLVERVMGVLNHHDPVGLIALGFPSNEYLAEAQELAQLLNVNGTVTRDEVDSVWLKWFSEPIASPGVAEAVAADLRALRA